MLLETCTVIAHQRHHGRTDDDSQMKKNNNHVVLKRIILALKTFTAAHGATIHLQVRHQLDPALKSVNKVWPASNYSFKQSILNWLDMHVSGFILI